MNNTVLADERQVRREIEKCLVLSNEAELEVQKFLAYYLLIRIGCYCELAFREILKTYSRPKHESFERYVAHNLEKMRSPIHQTLAQILGEFSEEWKSKMKEGSIVTHEQKDALTSLVKERNKVAHDGQNSDWGVNEISSKFDQVVKYFNSVNTLINT